MSEDKKTIEEFEQERGCMVVGEVDTTQELTESEFSDMLLTRQWLGVDFEHRTQFLTNNGYEVNRKNMMDTSLTVKVS